MTIVFVHGNPEVAAIWDPLLAELDRDDAITLSPPGFGAPVPEGFGATAPEYSSWLVGELESLEGPVDLIGHDWGGGHVIAAATARPDLVRQGVTDIAGCYDPAYTWHDMAQAWRTPGEGEAFVEAMDAMPFEDRVTTFESLGMPRAAALACTEAASEDRRRCILSLYRSADESIMAAIGRKFATVDARPDAHVIIATADDFTGGEVLARRTATAWDAQVHVLEGLGHWWMLQDPAQGAAVVEAIVA
jgi:pimeloyl-ACP methyl ester carboxylesterase